MTTSSLTTSLCFIKNHRSIHSCLTTSIVLLLLLNSLSPSTSGYPTATSVEEPTMVTTVKHNNDDDGMIRPNDSENDNSATRLHEEKGEHYFVDPASIKSNQRLLLENYENDAIDLLWREEAARSSGNIYNDDDYHYLMSYKSLSNEGWERIGRETKWWAKSADKDLSRQRRENSSESKKIEILPRDTMQLTDDAEHIRHLTQTLAILFLTTFFILLLIILIVIAGIAVARRIEIEDDEVWVDAQIARAKRMEEAAEWLRQQKTQDTALQSTNLSSTNKDENLPPQPAPPTKESSIQRRKNPGAHTDEGQTKSSGGSDDVTGQGPGLTGINQIPVTDDKGRKEEQNSTSSKSEPHEPNYRGPPEDVGRWEATGSTPSAAINTTGPLSSPKQTSNSPETDLSRPESYNARDDRDMKVSKSKMHHRQYNGGDFESNEADKEEPKHPIKNEQNQETDSSFSSLSFTTSPISTPSMKRQKRRSK